MSTCFSTLKLFFHVFVASQVVRSSASSLCKTWEWVLGMGYIWHNVQHSFINDALGTEWTFESRQTALKMAHASSFWAIVVCQWSFSISCKARKCSAFKQGLFKNGYLLTSLLVMYGLAIVLMCLNSFTRGMELGTMMVEIDDLYDYMFPVPVAIICLGYDEMRRLIIRKIPDGWLEEETCI